MNKPKINRPGHTGVFARPELVAIAGTASAGLLLSQLVYWFSPTSDGRPKLRVKRAGKLWLAKRRHDWSAEVGLTPRQYDGAVAHLIRLGLVQTNVWMFDGKPTCHLWLDMVGLDGLLFHRDRQLEFSERVERNHQAVNSCTEITYESTTEQKHERLTPQEHVREATLETVKEKGARQDEEKIEVEIADWIAERPGYAELRLERNFTVQDWKAKAIALVRGHEGQLESRTIKLATNSLAMLWKRSIQLKYGAEPELSKKEIGQLRHLLQPLLDNAPHVVEYAVKNWNRVVIEAKAWKGLTSAPLEPTVAFLVKHYDVPMSLYLQSIAKKAEPLIALPTVVRALTGAQELPGGKLQAATFEEVMAILGEVAYGQPDAVHGAA